MLIKLTHRMTNIHDQHNTAQTLTGLKVAGHNRSPMRFKFCRNLGITITRQIGDPPVFIQFEYDYLLGATRCFTGPGQRFLIRKGINGTRLTRIGSAGYGDFNTLVFG